MVQGAGGVHYLLISSPIGPQGAVHPWGRRGSSLGSLLLKFIQARQIGLEIEEGALTQLL
jgi:hypothetical protein